MAAHSTTGVLAIDGSPIAAARREPSWKHVLAAPESAGAAVSLLALASGDAGDAVDAALEQLGRFDAFVIGGPGVPRLLRLAA